MGAYSIEYRGVATEAAWGTSLITDATGTAYWIGVEAPGSTHPWIRRRFQWEHHLPLREYPEGVIHDRHTPEARLIFAPLDGVPLWYAFGESSNAGAGPYTHDLTFRDGSGAAAPDPPSFTWHRERVDPAAVLTDHRLQDTGCRFQDVRISCLAAKLFPSEYLIMDCGVVGKIHTNPAYSLTTKPTSRITAATPYTFSMITTKTLAAQDIAGMLGFELWWTRPINVLHVNQASAGTDYSYRVYAHTFSQLDGPYLRLYVEPESYPNIGAEDVATATGTKDLSLVITRAASDTITFTGTNWWPMHVTDPMVLPGQRAPATLIEGPLELLTGSITDSLAGATHYA